MRLKDIAYINPAYTGPDLGDQLVSFSPMECLRYDSLKPITISFSEAKGKYTFFKDNDILFAKVTPCFENQNIAIANNLVNGIGFGSSEINVLRLKSDVSLRYMFYVICSNRFYNTGCSSMCGVGGLKRINPRAVSTFEFTMPSLAEQEAIAAYLDKECEKIGRKIELLERKADAYSRLRRSLINRAVTRGLDPNKTFKTSKSSICTEIPSHWQEKRIKDIFTEKSIKGYPNEPMLCATQSKGVIPQSLYENRVVTAVSGLENMKLVDVGNFVISLRSFQGGIEYAYYRGIISAAYTILELDTNNSRNYFRHFFKSLSLIKLMKKCVTGIRDGQNINYTTLKYEHIPVPPIEEQKEIAAYLDEKCAKIDTILEKINTEVERLKELKRTLINEVVTGQRAIETESRS